MLPDPRLSFWDDWLLLFVQMLGLIFLVIYVIKTWQMAAATREAAESSRRAVEESVRARKEALAPRILVYFDGESTMAQIVIQNAGAGTAENVRLKFSPELQSSQPKQTMKFFDAPQPMIPPGYRHAQSFDTWPTYFKADLPPQYQVTVSYRGAENEIDYNVRYVLDTEAIRWQHVRTTEAAAIVEVLRKLNSSIVDEIRDVGRELRPLLWVGGVRASLPSTAKDAARELVALWRFIRSLQDMEHAYFPRQTFTELLRHRALSLAQFVPAATSDEQRNTVQAVSQALFTIESEHLGMTDWSERQDNAFEQLAVAFGVDDLRNGIGV